MEFAEFFCKATGKRPYAYQWALAEKEWPEVVIAPTGLGKTAAIVLAWLWRWQSNPREAPRRLVYCLPMRTLVEQTQRNVCIWLEQLGKAGFVDKIPASADVHLLMGGIEPKHDERRWYETPERPAILIGTQDMLISRALMRGYASRRARWPVEFALLHNDALWVFDEVQLMGVGLATSTQLQAFRDPRRLGSALPARSLWVSATLDPAWLCTVDFPKPQSILRVPHDIAEDASSPDIRRLIEAHKPLAKAPVAPAGAKKAEVDAYIREFADLVRKKRASRGRTLVIVNTVERAQKLHAALLKSGTSEDEIVLVHSRFRPTDRRKQMARLTETGDCIVVATQAIEAGVDLSSAVMITELAPWASLVQRFGRVNRYGEHKKEDGGAKVYWIDLLGEETDEDATAKQLALPYLPAELHASRKKLLALTDAAAVNLGDPGRLDAPRRVIRQKDLIDLFDTDPDLTGFDVDISPYVRDADDTDVHVFWRVLKTIAPDPVQPSRDELCAVSIGKAKEWIEGLRKGKRKLRAYAPDPLWQSEEGKRSGVPPGWQRLDGPPWPGMTVLVDIVAGGYDSARGFVGEASTEPVEQIKALPPEQTENDLDEDEKTNEGFIRPVTLTDHTEHVVAEARTLCAALRLSDAEKAAIVRAARWHDLGKAHPLFQDTMRRGLTDRAPYNGVLLAKTERRARHKRAYFRHELASALAFLAHEKWGREADLLAYLIAAHHGKVRMSLRARPEERLPDAGQAGARFARGIWEGDVLPAVDLGDGQTWSGGPLRLAVMELGEDEVTGASWTERTRALLDHYGPFRLAWLEALLTTADWRASAKERNATLGTPPAPMSGGSRE